MCYSNGTVSRFIVQHMYNSCCEECSGELNWQCMINALIWSSFIVPCVRCLNARGCHYMMNSEYTRTYSHMLCSHKGQIPFSVWWIDHKIVGHWLNVGWLEHSKRWVHTWMVSIAIMNHACSHPNFAKYSYIRVCHTSKVILENLPTTFASSILLSTLVEPT